MSYLKGITTPHIMWNNVMLSFQVFAMLPFQMLSGYPYKINDEDLYPCVRKPPPLELQRISRSIPYFPIYGKVDVYNVFKVRLFLRVHVGVIGSLIFRD